MAVHALHKEGSGQSHGQIFLSSITGSLCRWQSTLYIKKVGIKGHGQMI